MPKAKKPKLFNTAEGYATRTSRDDWLKYHPEVNPRDVPDGLVADLDPDKPLYFWQLFSLLGEKRITKFIKAFYTRIFKDTEPGQEWLRRAFERIGSLDHHVWTQSTFWCDAFGGGRYYHGGDYRLNFHHHHNAAHVMNADGAKRWMFHMRAELKATERSWNKIDERIFPCVVDFLRVKMQKYAKNHRFEFQESDFAFDEAATDKRKKKERPIREAIAVAGDDASTSAVAVLVKPTPNERNDAKAGGGDDAASQLDDDAVSQRDDTTAASLSSNGNNDDADEPAKAAPTSTSKCGGAKSDSSAPADKATLIATEKMPVPITEAAESAREALEKMPPITEEDSD